MTKNTLNTEMQVGDLSVAVEIIGDVDQVMTELRRARALGLNVRSGKLYVKRKRRIDGISISSVESGDGESARKSVATVSLMVSPETSARLHQLIDELAQVTR